MHITRLMAAAGVAFFAGGASLAYAQQAPYYGAPAGQMQQEYRGGGFRHFLTPEEKAMWVGQHRAGMRAMSHEQRKAYRQQLRQQFLAMSPAQRAQMRNQLQAQWAQLTPDRQQAIEQRIAAHQQRRSGQPGGQSFRHTQGYGSQGGYGPPQGQSYDADNEY